MIRRQHNSGDIVLMLLGERSQSIKIVPFEFTNELPVFRDSPTETGIAPSVHPMVGTLRLQDEATAGMLAGHTCCPSRDVGTILGENGPFRKVDALHHSLGQLHHSGGRLV